MRVCVCDTLNCARTRADLCRVNVCPSRTWGEELTFSGTTVDSGRHLSSYLLHPWERWAPLLVVAGGRGGMYGRARTPAETIVCVVSTLCLGQCGGTSRT